MGLSELSQWLENGEIVLNMNGHPVKKPLQVPGYINSTETERYKNGIVLNILEGGNLYLPCNLNASLSQDAKNLLIGLLRNEVPPISSIPGATNIATTVAISASNVLAFPVNSPGVTPDDPGNDPQTPTSHVITNPTSPSTDINNHI